MIVAIAENEYLSLKISCDNTLREWKVILNEIKNIETELKFASEANIPLLRNKLALLQAEEREKSGAIRGWIGKLGNLINECSIEVSKIDESLKEINKLKNNEIVRFSLEEQRNKMRDKARNYADLCHKIESYINSMNSILNSRFGDGDSQSSTRPSSNLGANMQMSMGYNDFTISEQSDVSAYKNSNDLYGDYNCLVEQDNDYKHEDSKSLVKTTSSRR